MRRVTGVLEGGPDPAQRRGVATSRPETPTTWPTSTPRPTSRTDRFSLLQLLQRGNVKIYLFYSSAFGVSSMGSSAAPFTPFFFNLWCAAQRRVLRAFYVLAYLLGSWGICQRLWNALGEHTGRKMEFTGQLGSAT